MQALALVSGAVVLIAPAPGTAQTGKQVDQSQMAVPGQADGQRSAKPAEKLLNKLPPEVARPPVVGQPVGPPSAVPGGPPGSSPIHKNEHP
jgi:hypothetical protein